MTDFIDDEDAHLETRKNRTARWRTLCIAAAVCAAASIAFPSTSLAHDPMYPKIGFHFRLGLAGDIDGESPGQRDAMEPSFGGGIELEVPVTVHFSLGGAIEAYGWTVGRASESYTASVDFLFMPRFRIPLGDHPWHGEIYFGLPIGPTLSVPHDRFAAAIGSTPLDVGVGVTGGGRFGGRINVNDVVGFFADVGPMVQFVSYPRPGGGPRVEVWHYQLVIRAGGSFGLGA
jgi:hypothetical protein